MKAVKSVRSVYKDCSRGGINESLSVGTGKENRLFTKKAQIVCVAAKHNKPKKNRTNVLGLFLL